LIIKKI